MGRPTKIVIQSIGSRGDSQPFIAVGSALKSAGYDVTLITNKDHISIIEESGLKGEGLFLDMEKAMKENANMRKAMAEGDVFAWQGAAGELMSADDESNIVDWFEAMERIKPDLILCGTGLNYFGALAERHLRIPVIMIGLQCWPMNPPKMIYGLPSLPCGCNKYIMRALFGEMYKTLAGSYDPACMKLKGFKASDFWTKQDLWESQLTGVFGTLIGLSPLVAKELDPDIPKNIIYCGHFSVGGGTAQVDKALETAKSGFFGSAGTIDAIKSFIDSGSKPAYMGWGSMTAKTPEYMVNLVAQAVKFAGSRAIVFEGWASLSMDTLRKATKDQALIEYAEKNLLFVGKTPHEWLFPQCSCIVHHGGSGTMATSARSGTPQVITPVWLDQWDHAIFLNKFGAGVGFEKTQLTSLSAKELGEAINKCESSSQIKAKAVEWGEITKKENGPQRVVEHVEWFWTECVETGKYEQWLTERLAAIEKERASRCCG